MNTVKAIRTGEIVVDLKHRSAVVPFKASETGNPSTMHLRMRFDEVKMDLWFFDENPGYCITDFSCYKIFSTEIDCQDIFNDVKTAFAEAEAKQAEEQDAQQRQKKLMVMKITSLSH